MSCKLAAAAVCCLAVGCTWVGCEALAHMLPRRWGLGWMRNGQAGRAVMRRRVRCTSLGWSANQLCSEHTRLEDLMMFKMMLMFVP